jgi:hypothetical protein
MATLELRFDVPAPGLKAGAVVLLNSVTTEASGFLWPLLSCSCLCFCWRFWRRGCLPLFIEPAWRSTSCYRTAMARALDERGQATAPTECYTREPPPIPGSARGRTTTPDPDQWSGLSVEIPGGEGIITTSSVS